MIAFQRGEVGWLAELYLYLGLLLTSVAIFYAGCSSGPPGSNL